MEIDPRARDIRSLAKALQVPLPRVADWNSIPKGLVLELADLLRVDLEDGTAEEQLAELIEVAGLVDERGEGLAFQRGNSVRVANPLARIASSEYQNASKRIKRSREFSLGAEIRNDAAARNKISAVNRLSRLTNSGPQTLGPGSKERKSVLENLHTGLGFGDPPNMTKTALGEHLAERLGVPWDRECFSTGQTITLEGLNRLLLGANRRLQPSPAERHLSLLQETEMYAAAILQTFIDNEEVDEETRTVVWNGQSVIEQMLKAEYRQARQTEWPGWYFEFRALNALSRKYRGGPRRVRNTTFDYFGERLWDLKAHSHSPGERHSPAPLNDKESILEAALSYGLGFIILSGEPHYENEERFYQWHLTEVRQRSAESRAARSRRLKTSFAVESIDFVYFRDFPAIRDAEDAGILSTFNQGRQQSGQPRPPKYNLHLDRALGNEDFHIHSVDVAEYFTKNPPYPRPTD